MGRSNAAPLREKQEGGVNPPRHAREKTNTGCRQDDGARNSEGGAKPPLQKQEPDAAAPEEQEEDADEDEGEGKADPEAESAPMAAEAEIGA